MIEFKPIKPKDREIFEKFYRYKTIQNAESSFANLCAYSFIFNGEWAIIDDCLVTRIHFEKNTHICYHYPLGEGDKDKIIEQLINLSKENNQQMSVICERKDRKPCFEHHFDIKEERNFFDYLYLREDLQYLKGKKFQPKRNHINKFNAKYKWDYIEINAKNYHSCLFLVDKWKEKAIEKNPELLADYEKEKKVIEYLFSNFDALDLKAGAIKVEEKIIAFTIGSKINNETFDIHIEKADRNFEGAFALINQEFAKRLDPCFKYINREEDLGIEGLRKAKLSYYPIKLIEKYIATLK